MLGGRVGFCEHRVVSRSLFRNKHFRTSCITISSSALHFVSCLIIQLVSHLITDLKVIQLALMSHLSFSF